MLSPFGAQKLILGGHTFLEELGNDPAASPDEQIAVVSACLEGGVRVVDTTYAVERRGLRTVLMAIDDPGIRPVIWNFFDHPEMDGNLPGPDPWTDERFEQALVELGLTEAPFVVVHAVGDAVADRAQIEVVRRLREEGRITHLGFWANLDADSKQGREALLQWDRFLEVENLWRFVVTPWNVMTYRENAEILKVAKAQGWTTLGTSPFVRGWELERRAVRVAGIRQIGLSAAVAQVADHMLRFSAFSPGVDHVVNAIRARRHVRPNLESIRQGPLAPNEREWILGLG
ncbi:MAG: hypothetical protein R3F07_09745 [Opitutaceae bacterium]